MVGIDEQYHLGKHSVLFEFDKRLDCVEFSLTQVEIRAVDTVATACCKIDVFLPGTSQHHYRRVAVLGKR